MGYIPVNSVFDGKFFAKIILILMVSGCTTTTTNVNNVWVEPDLQPKRYQNLLVLGVSSSDGTRRMYEESLVTALASQGSRAVASYKVLPDQGELSKATVEAAIAEYGYDGVIVTTMVAVDENVRRVPDRLITVPRGYRTMHGYYQMSYMVVHQEGYDVRSQTVTLETNLYDVAAGNLIWTGRSQTHRPNSAPDAVASITIAISEALAEVGVIGR